MGPFWTLFADIWAKMNFPGKKGCQILDIPIIYHRPKNQKKLMSHFWEKGQTTRQTDRQTGNDDFMGPFVDQGSKKGLQELLPFQSQITQSMHAIQFKAFNSKHAKVSTKWYMFLHISPSYLLIQQLPLQSLQTITSSPAANFQLPISLLY